MERFTFLILSAGFFLLFMEGYKLVMLFFTKTNPILYEQVLIPLGYGLAIVALIFFWGSGISGKLMLKLFPKDGASESSDSAHR